MRGALQIVFINSVNGPDISGDFLRKLLFGGGGGVSGRGVGGCREG